MIPGVIKFVILKKYVSVAIKKPPPTSTINFVITADPMYNIRVIQRPKVLYKYMLFTNACKENMRFEKTPYPIHDKTMYVIKLIIKEFEKISVCLVASK